MDIVANSLVDNCIELPVDKKRKYGYKTYKVGDRRFGFRSKWHNELIRRDVVRLSSMSKSRKGDICIIVGNGPSLNEIDFSLFKGHDVIISNNAFEAEDLLRRASYFTVVNHYKTGDFDSCSGNQ